MNKFVTHAFIAIVFGLGGFVAGVGDGTGSKRADGSSLLPPTVNAAQEARIDSLQALVDALVRNAQSDDTLQKQIADVLKSHASAIRELQVVVSQELLGNAEALEVPAVTPSAPAEQPLE